MVIWPIKGFLSSFKTKTLVVGYTFGLRRTQYYSIIIKRARPVLSFQRLDCKPRIGHLVANIQPINS